MVFCWGSNKTPNKDYAIESEEITLPKKSQEILDKKDILTRTDLILEKYRSNNDNP